MPLNEPEPQNRRPTPPPPPPFPSREVIVIHDDPERDGTDAAHPAWWRGQEYGFDGAMRMIERALTERPAGVIGNARWQALRERIHAMASRSRG